MTDTLLHHYSIGVTILIAKLCPTFDPMDVCAVYLLGHTMGKHIFVNITFSIQLVLVFLIASISPPRSIHNITIWKIVHVVQKEMHSTGYIFYLLLFPAHFLKGNSC